MNLREMAKELRAAGWVVIPPAGDAVDVPDLAVRVPEADLLTIRSDDPDPVVDRWAREIDGVWFLYERIKNPQPGGPRVQVWRVVPT